ncbi:programmed cell death protein 2 [Zychaea mexicana]|uniref:programmed cell death protein 2 n=1 Tax=Zychaea mexicana TaxID=64656 RepID=UPI0022FDFC0A|nr:programmed cell death protein 2 [Zychaea mexicana]KAI9496356.1 programmed cell death protein 2 [Zychaea mexicana]
MSDTDSDVSELDQRELSEAVAADKWVSQLGYCEDPETPLTADTFPSKSGGKPAWLNPEHVLDVENATCGNCSEPLILLLQLYTPEDEPVEAFHRAVYVFCCKNGGCHKQDWTQCFKVYRSQLPRDNPYYPPPEDEDEEQDDVAIDFTPKHFTPPKECVICGMAGTKACGKCQAAYYCSRQHQLVDWNSCGHKQYCNNSNAKEQTKLRAARLFTEMEIVSEPEGQGEDGKEEEAQKEHTSKETGERSNETALALRGDEAYENSAVDVDQAFLKFQLKLGLYPDQVVRYERVEYDMPDREPLWVQQGSKPSMVPACDRCGGPRTFEFQILPTLLNYLGISHTADDSLDWGSLYVYTCKHNCSISPEVFVPEYIWKQDFTAEGMKL